MVSIERRETRGRLSSFVVRRSSFVVRRSSFVVRRSSFVVRRSSAQWGAMELLADDMGLDEPSDGRLGIGAR